MAVRTPLDFSIRHFALDMSGATAIEYALIAAIMTGMIIVALALIDLDGVFTTIQNALDNA